MRRTIVCWGMKILCWLNAKAVLENLPRIALPVTGTGLDKCLKEWPQTPVTLYYSSRDRGYLCFTIGI